MLDPVATLAELVAIPSVNPMGRSPRPDEPFESHVTDYLERLFDRLEIGWRRQPVHPGRDNILAVVEGDAERGVLLLEAHQDTVPVDGMVIEPFRPDVRDGRMFGRGACDIKGGMAAMLAAVARLARERPAGMPTVVMSCTVNEEHGFTGASALAGSWRAAAGDAVTGDAAASGAVTGGAAADVFTRRPDAAVVAEPTELAVVVAHKGTVRWRCRTLGRAVHSSRPELGDNAIYHMARVLAALEQYQARIAPTLAAHPLCGRPSLSVGVIRGGISVNTVPDACEIEIDRRVLPGEDPVRARQEVIDHLAADPSLAGRVEHDPPFIETRGLTDRANGPLAAELIAAAGERIGRPEPIGVLFGTDAVALEAAGVPTVVFGPGSIEQAHTNDEWVEVEQVRRAADVLFDFARGFRAAAVPAGA